MHQVTVSRTGLCLVVLIEDAATESGLAVIGGGQAARIHVEVGVAANRLEFEPQQPAVVFRNHDLEVVGGSLRKGKTTIVIDAQRAAVTYGQVVVAGHHPLIEQAHRFAGQRERGSTRRLKLEIPGSRGQEWDSDHGLARGAGHGGTALRLVIVGQGTLTIVDAKRSATDILGELPAEDGRTVDLGRHLDAVEGTLRTGQRVADLTAIKLDQAGFHRLDFEIECSLGLDTPCLDCQRELAATEYGH